MVKKHSVFVVFVFLFIVLFGYVFFILPLKKQEEKGRELDALQKEEIGLLVRLPKQKAKISEELEKLASRQSDARYHLTIDKLAQLLQHNKLGVVSIEPESGRDGDQVFFVVQCSGEFKMLLNFLNQLLHSQTLVILSSFHLSEKSFVLRIMVLE